MGQFYFAGRNLQKALELDPSNPDTFGQLGIVFTRSRNFEGAIPALKCAIKGCTAQESCDARAVDNCTGAEVKPLVLSQSSVVYYYSYVSNLAALSRPKFDQCPEARQVIAQIRAGGFDSDPIVSQILSENENICALVGRGLTIPTSTTPPENLTPIAPPGAVRATQAATPTYKP